jgi:hypothetical protein
VPGPIFLESDELTKEFEAVRTRGVTFEESEPTPYPFCVRLTAVDPDGTRIARRRPGPGQGNDW